MSLRINGLGYIMIDHRNSPGIPPELQHAWAKAGKIAPDAPKNKLVEGDTCVCCHCGRVVILNPYRTRPRNSVVTCNHYVCDCP